jgi:uncharacterized GH25 family protein
MTFVKPTLTAVLLCVGTQANAHDFWLMPANFQLEAAGSTDVRILIGHGTEVDPWNLRWDRVVSLRSYAENGVTDHQSSIIATAEPVSGGVEAQLSAPGTHILAFESHHSFSVLAADKFNDYAEKEGLAVVLADRQKASTMGKPGRELYSRRAKALIQVGDNVTDNILRPIGLTLEIVPERHPYALGADRQLPVLVLFRGKPLENALIDLTDLGSGAEPTAGQRTDANGRAVFEIPDRGNWKINVIWGVPNSGNDRAEYETIFSSLTFGYPIHTK